MICGSLASRLATPSKLMFGMLIDGVVLSSYGCVSCCRQLMQAVGSFVAGAEVVVVRTKGLECKESFMFAVTC